MRLPSIVLAALLAVSASPAALAQPPAAPGSVTALATAKGSVLILRGGKVYELLNGDALYDGDQVFTRANGNTQLTFGTCNYTIAGEQSLVLKLPAVCSVLPTTLTSNAVIGGFNIATGVAGGGDGSLLLLLGGGAALVGLASLSGSNSSSP